MTFNVETFEAAGLESVHVSFKNGVYANGASPTALASGEDSGSLIVKMSQDFNLTLPDPRIVAGGGDDGPGQNFIFGPENTPQGSLVLGAANLSLAALAQGMNLYANGIYDENLLLPTHFDYKQMAIIANVRALSKDSGTLGLAGYYVQMFPNCQMVPKSSNGLSNATPTQFTHDIIANKVDTWPTGVALSAVNEGDTEAVGKEFWSPAPYTIHSLIADGVATTVTLDFAPLTADANGLQAFLAGAVQAYTTNYTVVVATKVVTLTAAGSDLDKWIFTYPYDRTS